MHLSDIFLLCALGGVSVLPLVFLNSESESSQLFLGKYKIPKETKDPINIDSKKVKEENDLKLKLKPFSLHATLSDKVKVVNTGKVVEVILAQHKTTSSVTGGVLKEDKYLFKKIKYIWTDNSTGIAATTIDNKGYPLENVAFFYNKKYGTFENALNHRDGLAAVDFFIDVCSNPNKKFEEYDKKLRKIQKAGSTVETTLGTSIIWFAGNGILSPTSSYYAYPGSYIDEETGKKYYCSTVIILPHLPQWCLSKKQYDETFGSFKNFLGKPLTNTETQFPRKMTVVRAKGILNSNTP